MFCFRRGLYGIRFTKHLSEVTGYNRNLTQVSDCPTHSSPYVKVIKIASRAVTIVSGGKNGYIIELCFGNFLYLSY